jgi:phosphoglycolate phosphatase-like HAD superfamily hydrolase
MGMFRRAKRGFIGDSAHDMQAAKFAGSAGISGRQGYLNMAEAGRRPLSGVSA